MVVPVLCRSDNTFRVHSATTATSLSDVASGASAWVAGGLSEAGLMGSFATIYGQVDGGELELASCGARQLYNRRFIASET